MTDDLEACLRDQCARHGQEHVFRFWNELNIDERMFLLDDLDQVDFGLMEVLIDTWVLNEPEAERFSSIAPIPLISRDAAEGEDGAEAAAAGEQALRDGRVGILVVAGGQGTRLGFSGPKGSYPIGPLTGKSLFQYHAEKLRNLRQRYDADIPWYVMVSPSNDAATREFFHKEDYFGLPTASVYFLAQRMVPCVDDAGKLMLESKCRLAMSPNGHGGCIPALVESGALDHARSRGVDILSYFQVDNWAAKAADPLFIGYHARRRAEMASKCHRRNSPREAVGVHCVCDGMYRVIEYSELDLYPKLLETDASGAPVFYAGNPAIHTLSADFARALYGRFSVFPWHRAHKKIPFVNDRGITEKPEAPNGYKFEAFVFDALRFVSHAPVALEIGRAGEYTPIKQYDGESSMAAARQAMADYWSQWLDAVGYAVPRAPDGRCAVPVEISPEFALSRDEFVTRARDLVPAALGDGIAISSKGSVCVK